MRTLAALSLAGGLAAGTMLAGGPGGPDGSPGPGGPGGRHGMAGHGLHHALSGLNLTQDQKNKIHAVLQGQRDSFQAQREQMRADHEALRALLESNQSDATAVGKATLKMEADRKALRAQRDAAIASVRAVLTPEQAAKLDGFIAAQKDRMEDRGFRGRHGPPPTE